MSGPTAATTADFAYHAARRMRSAVMRKIPVLTASATLVAALVLLSGCGRSIQAGADDPTHAGAVLFAERCAGCHTLAAAGTVGSLGIRNPNIRLAGPNFDTRAEKEACVLHAIRNGGFGGGLMPPNIVTGQQAAQVASFVEKWSGRQAPASPSTQEFDADVVAYRDCAPPPFRTVNGSDDTSY